MGKTIDCSLLGWQKTTCYTVDCMVCSGSKFAITSCYLLDVYAMLDSAFQSVTLQLMVMLLLLTVKHCTMIANLLERHVLICYAMCHFVAARCIFVHTQPASVQLGMGHELALSANVVTVILFYGKS